ncbi:MAG TPA: type 4 pilin [Cyanothece sp. UBA12306]|nr:type 4 pilin [Cyanothece sp. UBA12306]
MNPKLKLLLLSPPRNRGFIYSQPSRLENQSEERSLPLESQNNGFTMMEVLVAILVSFAFLMGTLQAMTISAYFQVKSERQARAKFWIQDDIALVSSIAGTEFDDLTTAEQTAYESRCGNTGNNGIGAYLTSTLPQIGTPTITANRTVQIVEDGKEIFNKQYRLVRITEVPTNQPEMLQITYRVGVRDDTDTDDGLANIDPDTGKNSVIAENYTEFIPLASLSCP